LLEHAQHGALAFALRGAILAAIAGGKTTRDVGGVLGTLEFTARVCDALTSAIS